MGVGQHQTFMAVDDHAGTEAFLGVAPFGAREGQVEKLLEQRAEKVVEAGPVALHNRGGGNAHHGGAHGLHGAHNGRIAQILVLSGVRAPGTRQQRQTFRKAREQRLFAAFSPFRDVPPENNHRTQNHSQQDARARSPAQPANLRELKYHQSPHRVPAPSKYGALFFRCAFSAAFPRIQWP